MPTLQKVCSIFRAEQMKGYFGWKKTLFSPLVQYTYMCSNKLERKKNPSIFLDPAHCWRYFHWKTVQINDKKVTLGISAYPLSWTQNQIITLDIQHLLINQYMALALTIFAHRASFGKLLKKGFNPILCKFAPIIVPNLQYVDYISKSNSDQLQRNFYKGCGFYYFPFDT